MSSIVTYSSAQLSRFRLKTLHQSHHNTFIRHILELFNFCNCPTCPHFNCPTFPPFVVITPAITDYTLLHIIIHFII